MSTSRDPASRILGTGHYAPAKVLTNAELERMVDTSDAWISERTGIRERRIAAEGELTSDMAAAAGRSALEAAGSACRRSRHDHRWHGHRRQPDAGHGGARAAEDRRGQFPRSTSPRRARDSSTG